MKTKLSNVLIAVQAIAAACIIGAVKVWAPVCAKMLELANGNQTHMKCYYAGQAAVGVAVIMLACAVLALLAKKGHKSLMAVNAVAAVVLFLVFTSLIGVCANEEMRCNVTKVWGMAAAGVTIVTSLVELFSSREGQIPG